MTAPSTWGEAVRQAAWPDVAAVLVIICASEFARPADDDPITIDLYRRAFERLRQLEPIAVSWRLHIVAPDLRDPDDGPAAHVWQERPNDNEDGELYPGGITHWAPYLSPWPEWLGATLVAPEDYSAAEIVAHGLAELTWGGFAPEGDA